jgi:hypothetical protein
MAGNAGQVPSLGLAIAVLRLLQFLQRLRFAGKLFVMQTKLNNRMNGCFVTPYLPT